MSPSPSSSSSEASHTTVLTTVTSTTSIDDTSPAAPPPPPPLALLTGCCRPRTEAELRPQAVPVYRPFANGEDGSEGDEDGYPTLTVPCSSQYTMSWTIRNNQSGNRALQGPLYIFPSMTKGKPTLLGGLGKRWWDDHVLPAGAYVPPGGEFTVRVPAMKAVDEPREMRTYYYHLCEPCPLDEDGLSSGGIQSICELCIDIEFVEAVEK